MHVTTLPRVKLRTRRRLHHRRRAPHACGRIQVYIYIYIIYIPYIYTVCVLYNFTLPIYVLYMFYICMIQPYLRLNRALAAAFTASSARPTPSTD